MEFNFKETFGKTDKIIVAYGAAKGVYELAKRANQKYKNYTNYTVTVGAGDEIYEELHTWLLSKIPDRDKHVLSAVTENRSRMDYPDSDDSSTKKESVSLFYASTGYQTVDIDGYKIRVMIHSKIPEGINAADLPASMKSAFEVMYFIASSTAGRDSLIRHLNQVMITKRNKKNKPVLRVRANWGEWVTRNDLPPRHLDSVVLKEGQMEAILADFKEFMDSEERYNKLSLSWHRGYLFHGPAGTGKSSIAKVLAHHFNMPIYYMPLGDLKDDTALNNAFSSVKPRSILLLEDIDIFDAATERGQSDKITMSGLLNALDGINTPHGLVTIMTTNNKNLLDPALIRAGRIDRQEELGFVNFYQFRNMVTWFYGVEEPFNPLFTNLEDLEISPATIVDLFCQYKNSYKDGVDAAYEHFMDKMTDNSWYVARDREML